MVGLALAMQSLTSKFAYGIPASFALKINEKPPLAAQPGIRNFAA